MKRDRQSIEDRHTRILALCQERQEIKVDELAKIFQVSMMTIRRDLQYLEEQGLLHRFYGGAAATSNTPAKEDADRVQLYRDLISRYAATLVQPNDRIFINGSNTALGILAYITQPNVHVFTNNGHVCERQYPDTLQITLSGGTLRRQGTILTGDCAMRNLLTIQSDKTFLGCTGISPSGELLCGIPTELAINETMISHSSQYFILADHTKVGVAGTYASIHLEKAGTVITDELAPFSVVEQLRLSGMKVIQVHSGGATL